MAMETCARMRTTMTLKVKHEGETGQISQEDLRRSLISAIQELFEEEIDEDIPVELSLYISDFKYEDNLTVLKEKAYRMISEMEPEEIIELLAEHGHGEDNE